MPEVASVKSLASIPDLLVASPAEYVKLLVLTSVRQLPSTPLLSTPVLPHSDRVAAVAEGRCWLLGGREAGRCLDTLSQDRSLLWQYFMCMRLWIWQS